MRRYSALPAWPRRVPKSGSFESVLNGVIRWLLQWTACAGLFFPFGECAMRLSLTPFRCFAVVTLVAGFTALHVAADDRLAGTDPAPLSLARTIALPMITGGMNHLAADAARSRFFVTS